MAKLNLDSLDFRISSIDTTSIVKQTASSSSNLYFSTGIPKDTLPILNTSSFICSTVVDSMNNLYVSGIYNTDATLPIYGLYSTISSISLPNYGPNAIPFVIKFNQLYNPISWSIITASGEQAPPRICIGYNDSIYFAGSALYSSSGLTTPTIGNFSTSSSISYTNMVFPNIYDYYVGYIIKYNKNGNAESYTIIDGDNGCSISSAYYYLGNMYVCVTCSAEQLNFYDFSTNSSTSVFSPNIGFSTNTIVRYQNDKFHSFGYLNKELDTSFASITSNDDYIYACGKYFDSSSAVFITELSSTMPSTSLNLFETPDTSCIIAKWDQRSGNIVSFMASYNQPSTSNILNMTLNNSNVYAVGLGINNKWINNFTNNLLQTGSYLLPGGGFLAKWNNDGIITAYTYIGSDTTTRSVAVDYKNNVYFNGYVNGNANVYTFSLTPQSTGKTITGTGVYSIKYGNDNNNDNDDIAYNFIENCDSATCSIDLMNNFILQTNMVGATYVSSYENIDTNLGPTIFGFSAIGASVAIFDPSGSAQYLHENPTLYGINKKPIADAILNPVTKDYIPKKINLITTNANNILIENSTTILDAPPNNITDNSPILYNATAFAITSDYYGNVYITGNYIGLNTNVYSVNGSIAFTLPKCSNNTPTSYIIKFNNNGLAIGWTIISRTTFKYREPASIYSITTDSSNNLYVAGLYNSTQYIYDFSSTNVYGLSRFTLPSIQTDSAHFFLKYSSDGVASMLSYLDAARGPPTIAVDISANIYAGGSYSTTSATVSLYNLSTSSSLVLNNNFTAPQTDNSAYIIKWAPNGVITGFNSFQGADLGSCFQTITTDQELNVYAAGVYKSSCILKNLCNGNGSITLPLGLNVSLFLAKWNANGYIQGASWIKNINTDTTTAPYFITNYSTKVITDIYNNIYLASLYKNTGVAPIYNITQSLSTDVQFQIPAATTSLVNGYINILKWTTDGIANSWAMVNSPADYASIAVDQIGSVYLGSMTQTTSPVVGYSFSSTNTVNSNDSTTISSTSTYNTFTAAASTVVPHYEYGYIVLDNGYILLAGGQTSESISGGNFSSVTPICELYDQNINKWITTGSMNIARRSFGFCLMKDGNVMVAGGLNASQAVLSSCEIYNVNSGTWTTTASLTTARCYMLLYPLPINGGIFCFGGATSTNPSNATDVYQIFNQNTRLWSTQNISGTLGLAGYNIIGMPDNQNILIAAGQGTGVSEFSVYYNELTNTFTNTTSTMDDNDPYATLMLAPNGNVISTGLVGQLYNPVTQQWTTIFNNATYAMNFTYGQSIILPNGLVFAYGADPDNDDPFAYLYNITTNTFVNLAPPYPSYSQYSKCLCTTLLNGKILINIATENNSSLMYFFNPTITKNYAIKWLPSGELEAYSVSVVGGNAVNWTPNNYSINVDNKGYLNAIGSNFSLVPATEMSMTPVANSTMGSYAVNAIGTPNVNSFVNTSVVMSKWNQNGNVTYQSSMPFYVNLLDPNQIQNPNHTCTNEIYVANNNWDYYVSLNGTQKLLKKGLNRFFWNGNQWIYMT